MNWGNRLLYASLGRKIIMGVTGLFLCLFLVAHLSGNLLLLKDDGGMAFNEYAEFMSSNLLVRAMEVVLVFGFLFHIVDALVLTWKNRRARPARYAMSRASETTDWTSRNMGVTGSIILVFLIVHLDTFVVDQRILGTHTSMYRAVVLAFQEGWAGWYWAFYVVAMILLGLHLHHGFRSAFQSLGLSHTKYRPLIEKVGGLFSILIPAGFAVLPIYFYFVLVAP